MKFSIENIKPLIEDFNKQKIKLENMTSPILENRNLTQQEKLEVCQIGKFLVNLDSEITIADKPKPPQPDFIVKCPLGLVGIEHTSILTEYAQQFNSINQLVSKAENIFKELYPTEKKVFADIRFNDDNFSFKKKDSANLAQVIAKYVYCALNNIKMEKPLFLREINRVHRIHDRVGFVYLEENWRHQSLQKEVLQKSILNKEKKLPSYKNNNENIKEYWLVVLIGSLSSASYELDENEDYRMDSKFDRVYLYCDFDERIINIK